jgi:alpha-methylacyl-CoA racemase
MDEAETHPQAIARDAFVTIDGVAQPAPGPRFDGAAGEVRIAPEVASRSNPEALAAWGVAGDEIASLKADGVVS